jgi:hypothetical protein
VAESRAIIDGDRLAQGKFQTCAERLIHRLRCLLLPWHHGSTDPAAADSRRSRRRTAACLEPAAPSGDLAALAEAIGAAPHEDPIVTERMRTELNGFLSWYVLTDFVARLQTSAAGGRDFLVKSTATVIGRIAGDAIRVSPEETTLARRSDGGLLTWPRRASGLLSAG